MTQTANETINIHQVKSYGQDGDESQFVDSDSKPLKKFRSNNASIVVRYSSNNNTNNNNDNTNNNDNNNQNASNADTMNNPSNENQAIGINSIDGTKSKTSNNDNILDAISIEDDTNNIRSSSSGAENYQLFSANNTSKEKQTLIDWQTEQDSSLTSDHSTNSTTTDYHHHQHQKQHLKTGQSNQKQHRQSNDIVDSAHNDDDDDDDDDTISLKFLIRRREAGAIIGKKGSNIRQLRDTFESEFLIPDTGNGPERVLNISTNAKVIDQILKQLTGLLHEKSLTIDGDEQVELRMLIHSSHAGTIIGKGGTAIRKLRDESKAAIKIFALCCPLSNERVVAIKGKPPIVVTTIKLVLNVISGSCIKGVVKPYDALNFDQNISDRYGGYSDETDTPNSNRPQFLAPQQLSPPPFMTSPFNPAPPNHFFPNGSYRLHNNAPNNMGSHQNCVPCKSVFSANQFPPPCTNCHHQRGNQHCAHFVPHQHQIAYHQKCDDRFCSCYHQVAHSNQISQNNVRHHTKFNRIRM